MQKIMENSPLVSIALCTFNGADFLKEQLESIVCQSYKNIELIIVDDCSTDGTVQIIQDFIKDSNVKSSFYRNEVNVGYVKNFEKAIKLCNGAYIALSDQDDIWSLDKIDKLVSGIGDNLLIYHDSAFMDKHGKPLSVRMSDVFNMYEGDDPIPFLLFNCISGHSCLFASSIVEKLLPFSDQHFHDWWIAYVCINLGTIKYIDECLVRYRRHEESVVSKETDMERHDTKARKYLQKIQNKQETALLQYLWLKKCYEFAYNKYPKFVSVLYFRFKSRLKYWFTPITFAILFLFNKRLLFIRKAHNAFGEISHGRYLRKNYLFGVNGVKIWYNIKSTLRSKKSI
ncbi:glycosyltransferase family 2 protein [Olivibacter sp. SDN3]|uniref:glycosyltransferase family 2 protein n=1 Tax=Olivibacter sp. SDN3 TaxID=2764720 RepID=UPI0016519C4A|nr:glycosyltransferase family 2 protein [Olivibacter sp. SDN3]QNL47733.1 glycosyltransferase family 2 protein [Olivibacter sp. SDN3]